MSIQTAFGRLEFPDDRNLVVIEKLAEFLEKSRSRELFCYPSIAWPYLMTGGKNPTPYQFFSPRYNDPSQVREILSVLEARQVPYVVAMPYLAGRQSDPILQYVREHYEYIPLQGTRNRPQIQLFTRKPTEPSQGEPGCGEKTA